MISFPVDSMSKKLTVDDEILVYAEVQPINPPLNPYQFNYKDYLEKQGIQHRIKANFTSVMVRDNPSVTLCGLASKFRNHIISKLKNEAFGKKELSVIQALLLGQRDGISNETYGNYKNAGAIHILAVSGLHVVSYY